MIKLIRMLFIVLIASMLAAPAAFAKHDERKESLTALGDSIPFGFNLTPENERPSKMAFPYLIGDEADLRVRNLSVTGSQTDDLLNLLEHKAKYRQAIKHAEYVTVTIGSNDFLQILREAHTESGGDFALLEQLLLKKIAESDAFDTIAAILMEIRSLTDAPIVLYNVYNPFQLSDPLHAAADKALPQINAAYKELSERYPEVYLADADSAFGNNQEEFVIPGDIHPTEAGHAILAEIGLEALCVAPVYK